MRLLLHERLDHHRVLSRLEPEAAAYRVLLSSHRRLQLEHIVVDSQPTQRCQPHQLLGQPISKPAPGFTEKRIIQTTACDRDIPLKPEGMVQSQHATGLEQLQIHLNRSTAENGMLQRQALKTHLPGLQARSLQMSTQQPKT